jgi:H+-transporting ATPase
MAERRISYAPDVENGDHSRQPDINDGAGLDEYAALNRYISTARDKRRGSTSSAGAMSTKKTKKSWQFWKKGGDGVDEGFVTPDEWADTDMRSGLRSTDVEARRKRIGWNELTTEKTNFFVQFIGYFRGPILYGMFARRLTTRGRPR